MGTKGIWHRPKSEYVTQEEIDANWDAVLGRDNEREGKCEVCGSDCTDEHCDNLIRQQKERTA